MRYLQETESRNTRQKAKNSYWSRSRITTSQREALNRHTGCIVWLTGLSGAGKSTIAVRLEQALYKLRRRAYILDGDNIRHGLCSDLGFSHDDRTENIRRTGEVARLFADAGIICIAAFISPYRADRDLARRIAPRGKFLEVYVNAPLEVCEERDPKGLYARARAGELKNFTGISAPYEPPAKPEIELNTNELSVTECVGIILKRLDKLLPAANKRR
jgi:adenylyl-sulfate kinase